MSTWGRSEDSWTWGQNVRKEARKLSLQINSGAISGPDIADAIAALVFRAHDARDRCVARSSEPVGDEGQR